MNIKNMNFSKEEKGKMLEQAEKLLTITNLCAEISNNDFMKIRGKIDKMSIMSMKLDDSFMDNFKNTNKSRDLNIILQQAIDFLEEILGGE